MKEGEPSKALFKIAALDAINKCTDTAEMYQTKQQIEQISVDYQVLCDETAMVAVIRDLNPVTGELKTHEMTQEST